jgi:NADPH-dependent 2,4-dienoyl-CoA reductase/sulfur reductase-like enzyme
MITYENRPAYDRPVLSKAYLQGNLEKESLRLRPEKFYPDHGIELMLKKRVTDVNTKTKTISLDGSQTLKYDRLLISSGGVPRRLEVPGADLKNVFLLRNVNDCEAIISALNHANRAAVIGAGFIGMETAFSLTRRKNIPVTIIGQESAPFEKVFGREIGQLVQTLHEKNGTTFKLGRGIQRFEGSDRVKAVVLDNGERIEADLVIVGVGVRPATDFLRDLPKQPDGSLKVDRFFRVQPDVWAAGDVARYTDPFTNEDIRIEHWRTALQQGRCAAFNMAGKETPYDGVPFFWTSQVGLGLRYVGHAATWDEIIIQGSIPSQEFVAFYVKNGQVRAAAGNKRDTVMNAVHELLRTRRMPSADELRVNPNMNLIALAEHPEALVQA